MIFACSALSHYLYQCWPVVNWTLGNIFQLNFNRNSHNFIEDLKISSRELTHWGPTKMGDILQTTFSNANLWNESVWISNKMSLKCIPWGLVDKSTLLQVMAWCQPCHYTTQWRADSQTHICVTRPQYVSGNYHMTPVRITRRINSLDCSILMLSLLMSSESEHHDFTTSVSV